MISAPTSSVTATASPSDRGVRLPYGRANKRLQRHLNHKSAFLTGKDDMSKTGSGVQLAADIGGTFTDIVLETGDRS